MKEEVQLLPHPKKEVDFKTIQNTMSQINFPTPDWAKEYAAVIKASPTKTGSSS